MQFLFLFLYGLLGGLQALKAVRMWQRKEYRFDKFWDFFRTQEAIWFVCDVPSVLLLLASVVAALGGVWQGVSVAMLGVSCIWLCVLLIGRNLHPIITAKAVLITGLVVSVLSVTAVASAHVSSLYGILIAVPWAAVGLVILLLYPVDYALKSRVWKAALTRRMGELSQLNVVAVSGSYGKTTVKDIVHTLMQPGGDVYKTHAFQNTTLSVARRLLNLPATATTFIAEIGAYRVGDGVDICQFIRPSSAIITGLNQQHFSLFGSIDNIITAESESLRFLEPGQIAVINWNSDLCRKICIPGGVKCIRYGLHDQPHGSAPLDYSASEIYFDGQYTHFTLDIRGTKTRLKTNLTSLGNIQNIVGAIAIAHSHTVGLTDIIPLLTKLQLPDKTLQSISMPWGTLIDDSHNANIDGVLNALSLVAETKKPSLIILDEIMELGSLSEDIHRTVARRLYAIQPDKIAVLGKSYSAVVRDQLIQCGHDPDQVRIFEGKNGDEIAQWLAPETIPGCVVLAEGFRARYAVQSLT